MKKTSLLFILSFVLLIFVNQTVNASHGTGGELTWRCLGTGEYVFQLKFYRDCNGIPAPNSILISTTVPGLATISAPKISVTDISPSGFLNNGFAPCPTCSLPGGNPGVIEEHVYESAPVILNGIPPTQGWEFYWGECCRSTAISNINNAGSLGFRLIAKMFSYNGQNADPCYDSSPYFIERPHSVVCSNLPVVYNHLSADNEFDSLTYEFTDPLDELGNAITYAPGYSVTSPLPGTNTLEAQTGEFFSNGSTGGYYVTAIKATSYKCGIKVAEITREVNVIIINNCPPIMGGTMNLPPLVNAPFTDPVSGLFTSYADTVIAGDLANFQLNITDMELFTNGDFQMINYNAYGLQYGDNYTNTSTGCLIPPCATLSMPPPVTAAAALSLQFNWQTTTAHLGYSFSCVQFSNTYYFINRGQDNYCPANGIDSRVFSITVETAMLPPPVNNNGGVLECPLGSGYIYQWFLNRFAIQGANTSSYTPVQPGIYQVLAVAQNGDGNYSQEYNYNPLGIYENNVLSSVIIQPNPSKDGRYSLNLKTGKSESVSLTVTDILGKSILTSGFITEKGENTFNLNLQDAPNGIYTLTLKAGNNKSNYYKLVKSE